MTFLYLKAAHIIFVVTWFAGLFYTVRLFIYATEANEKPEPARSILTDQFKIMLSRLWYGITWPSAIITLILGILLLINEPDFLKQPFMHIKLTLVFLLYLYHASLDYITRLVRRSVFRYSSQQLRIWNEVATLLLFGIVFLIVLKNALSVVWGIVGMVVLSVLILAGIRLYKSIRK